MNGERYKILGGVLALKSFTSAELAEAAGVNPNTVSSWLQRAARKGEFVEGTDKSVQAGSGRPRRVWRLREDAADQIRAMIDEIGATVRAEISTDEEAVAAFADQDIRLMVRRHLLLASRAPDEDARIEEIAEARDWLTHEQERLGSWIEDGFRCPAKVQNDLNLLEMWMQGLELRVDRLWFDERGRDIVRMADWLTAGVTGWFADPVTIGTGLFAPLTLGVPADLDRRESLVRQLMVVVRTAEHVATVPLDRVIGALLMTLPRLTNQVARDAICDILKETGFRRIGQALRVRMNTQHDSTRERRFTLHVLSALESFPQLLQDDMVGAWFDALPYSRLWAPSFVDNYLCCIEHRPHANLMRVLQDKAPELEDLRNRLREPDEDWQEETRGLDLDPSWIIGRIGRQLKDLKIWQDTWKTDMALGWTQRFSAGT